jgi:ketosteroid isomerase-like protein
MDTSVGAWGMSAENRGPGLFLLEAFGCHIRIEGSDSDVLRLVWNTLRTETCLEVCGEPAPRADVVLRIQLLEVWHVEVWTDHGLDSESGYATVEEMMDSILDLWHHPLALRTKDVTVVHAGVVAFGSRAVVFPGRSGAGKSTLIHMLVQRGATYLSDEFAMFDAGGGLHAFGKPISLRLPRLGAERDEFNGPSLSEHNNRLHVHVSAPPARERFACAVILCVAFREGSVWQPQQMSRSEGYFELVRNTVTARIRPAEMMTSLSAALNGATVFRADRPGVDSSDVADELAGAIRKLLPG